MGAGNMQYWAPGTRLNAPSHLSLTPTGLFPLRISSLDTYVMPISVSEIHAIYSMCSEQILSLLIHKGETRRY